MTDHIVILDGYPVNPGDLDWGPISGLGELTVHPRSPASTVLGRIGDARCVLLNKVPLTKAALAAVPRLRYVGVLATGFNVVDVQAAKELGIIVTNIPAYSTDSVAQHAAALMLEYARGLNVHARAVQQGEWVTSPDWCFARRPMFELNGKTLGIIGVGRIGVAFARIAQAMGMRLVGNAPRWPTAERLQGLAIESLELDDVFRQADVLSLHCPLTSNNQYMVNRARLALMKPNALLINTSRGQLIDNGALAEALHTNRIGGAALDVLDVEPPPASHPLLEAPRCVLTPHIAWNAIEARRRLIQVAADNLRAFQVGKPINVVNP